MAHGPEVRDAVAEELSDLPVGKTLAVNWYKDDDA